jgi:hypothetical protein
MVPLGSQYGIVLNDRRVRDAFIAEANARHATRAVSIGHRSAIEILQWFLARVRANVVGFGATNSGPQRGWPALSRN